MNHGYFLSLQTIFVPTNEQPIMRTEDRLFDKRMGEVRNGDQKVRKHLFSEILYGRQAVFYEDFFSRIIWVGRVQKSP